MSMTNCVNCGSAKDVNETVCPFCGTSYFDLTDIDLSGNKLCVLRLKMPGSGNIFEMKAYPRMANITMEPDFYSMRDVTGRLHRVERSMNITADISFAGVR